MAEQNFKIFRNSHQADPNNSRYFPCLMPCIKNTKNISIIVLLLILVIFGIYFFKKTFTEEEKDYSKPSQKTTAYFIESSSTG
jgi:putative Mn2+ efflux pump MntP